MVQLPYQLEILAPAGDIESALAAAEAGAHAVYFGLPEFNARRRAQNVLPEDLPELVQTLHKYGTKAYLTLNIDIAQRELAEAARYYLLAKEVGIDAVIVKDLCFIEFGRYLGYLPLHLSTQAGVSTSTGVLFAKELGIKRVILARELTKDEIQQLSSIEGVETEIFVQGAMCFCVSGRCLLSSWIGGRSGNRGLCASPCRMEWFRGGQKDGEGERLMSMKDLSLLSHLDSIAQIGVKALKIEGRLKKASWVRDTVTLIRLQQDVLQGISNESVGFNRSSLERLGDYAGRLLTDGFFSADRDHLIAPSGRMKYEPLEREGEGQDDKFPSPKKEPVVQLTVTEKDVDHWLVKIALDLPDQTFQLRRVFLEPITLEIKKRKNIQLTHAIAMEEIANALSRELSIRVVYTSSPPPRSFFSIADKERIQSRIQSLLNQWKKPIKSKVKYPLPNQFLAVIKQKNPINIQRNPQRNNRVDRIRIRASQLSLWKPQWDHFSWIVECRTQDDILQLPINLVEEQRITLALPSIFYEQDRAELESILRYCADHHGRVEANNLDLIPMLRKYSLPWEAGIGLMVLNSMAAQVLVKHGAQKVTISLEADRRKVEEMIESNPNLPWQLYVFGRPRLMQTRVHISQHPLHLLEKRGLEIQGIPEGELFTFYPLTPYRWDVSPNLPADFILDLVFSPNPLHEFQQWHLQPVSSFNFERQLK